MVNSEFVPLKPPEMDSLASVVIDTYPKCCVTLPSYDFRSKNVKSNSRKSMEIDGIPMKIQRNS